MGQMEIWLMAVTLPAMALFCCADKVIIDMTHEYKVNKTAYWPTDFPRIDLEEVFVGDSGGYWLELYKFSTVDHAGTHIDAPSHFTKGGTTVDKIPIEKLVAPAVVIDISDKASSDSDAQVTIEDIKDWEDTNGKIYNRSVVLMNSGWEKWYSNKTAYFGSDDVDELHFPAFHENAAKWLIDNRDINGIGVDTPSLDFGKSTSFLTHRTVLNNGRYGLENLKNVGKIPASGASLFVMPMKIAGAGGAPTRVVAIFEDDDSSDSKNIN